MAETGGASGASPPQLRVPNQPPPPSSFDATSLTSPGPMTLVSNFFSDHYPDTDLRSFSQLLAEILPSPIPQNPPAPHHDHNHKPNEQNEPMDLDIKPPLSGFGFHPQLQVSDFLPTIQSSDPEDSQMEFLDGFSLSESGNSKIKSVISLNKPASDGYNWKKYGQKQVKASELPRSYYKCTHLNCSVTKKIGHFLDGNVSQIIYKGQHNHEPPLVHKGAKDGAAMAKPKDTDEQFKLMTDGHNPKRRNWASSSTVMVTEPKIMVQTRSEVDILEDGFKWRKYGQKVVKGNTYPRSYYRCTYVGCKVRKHVERAVSDPKSVVTTYEGRHKHDIPVAAKPSGQTEIDFKTDVPVLLKLKEEEIIA